MKCTHLSKVQQSANEKIFFTTISSTSLQIRLSRTHAGPTDQIITLTFHIFCQTWVFFTSLRFWCMLAVHAPHGVWPSAVFASTYPKTREAVLKATAVRSPLFVYVCLKSGSQLACQAPGALPFDTIQGGRGHEGWGTWEQGDMGRGGDMGEGEGDKGEGEGTGTSSPGCLYCTTSRCLPLQVLRTIIVRTLTAFGCMCQCSTETLSTCLHLKSYPLGARCQDRPKKEPLMFGITQGGHKCDTSKSGNCVEEIYGPWWRITLQFRSRS